MIKVVSNNPNPKTTPNWKRVSNIKHLATIGEQFASTPTPKEVDRDGCVATLMTVIQRETEKLESSLEAVLHPQSSQK